MTQSPPPHDSPGVRIFPPVIYASVIALGALLEWLVPLHFVYASMHNAARVTGWVLVTVGTLVMLSAVLVFRLAGTTPNPTQPTTALVIRGPYRVMRNPMYVGMIAICTGIAAIANVGWILLLLVPAVIVNRRAVINLEERYLRAKFGAPYEDYLNSVRRWI